MDFAGQLVYLAGITPRSGTNWLYELIPGHPECERGLGWEDHFVHHADHLSAYAQALRGSWKEDWPLHERNAENAVLRQFGIGLRRVLACSNDESGSCDVKRRDDISDGIRILTKTPSVRNVDHFFRIFSDAQLVILVRDGRSVVESGMRTFDWAFENAVVRWRDAAETILQFDEVKSDSPYYIIRYEDLYRDTINELRDLFDFLGLDSATYDFGEALGAPVVGSSAYGQNEDSVSWEPVEKEDDFDPLRRWESWSAATHDRYNWIAEKELRAFGYEPVTSSAEWKRWVRCRYWDGRKMTSNAVRRVRRGIAHCMMP